MQCKSHISTQVVPPFDTSVENPGCANGSTNGLPSTKAFQPLQLDVTAGAAASSSRCVTRVGDPGALASAPKSSMRATPKKSLLVPIASAPNVPEMFSIRTLHAMQLSRSNYIPAAAFETDTTPLADSLQSNDARWAQPVPLTPRPPFGVPPLIKRAQSCPDPKSAAEEGAVWGDAVAEWAKDDGATSNLGWGDWGHWKEVSEGPPIKNESPVMNEPSAIVAAQPNRTATDEKAEWFGWADESFDGAFFPFFPSEDFVPITNARDPAASMDTPTNTLPALVLDARVTPRRQVMPNESLLSCGRSAATSMFGPPHKTESSPVSVTYPPTTSMASPLTKQVVSENMSQELTQEAALS